MTRRILAISIAIVLAALGTAAGLVLVLSADARAQNRISDPVTVVIAVKRIAVGTTGASLRTGEMVRMEKMPKASVPSDALPEIGPELDKLVVTSSIAPGQILLAANFGEQSKVTSGLALPEGKMAVTVETGAPEQVAGYVQVGSQVAIFLTYTVVEPNGTRTNIQRTRVLLPRVEVLAVGTYQSTRTTTGGTTGTAGSAARSGSVMLTVAVSQADAERLIEGLSHGTLYLGLLTDSVQISPGSGVDNTDGGSGGSPLFP
jgi:pilus assembly protein CpaB